MSVFWAPLLSLFSSDLKPRFLFPCAMEGWGEEISYPVDALLFDLGDDAIHHWTIFPAKGPVVFLVSLVVVKMGPFQVLAIFSFPQKKKCYAMYLSIGISSNMPLLCTFPPTLPCGSWRAMNNRYLNSMGTPPFAMSNEVIYFHPLNFRKAHLNKVNISCCSCLPFQTSSRS